MSAKHPITIHYHRDFDGMVSAAVLAKILRSVHDEEVLWASVNYDQRKNWEDFERGRRIAIVDFHFHKRAEYWFDHHPTTFLTPEDRAAYAPSERWVWDESSPSCPPIILKHAKQYWNFEAPERFDEMAEWSNLIDAALYKDVEQALFGDAPALRISRALSAAPGPDWTDKLVEAMIEGSLNEVAQRADVEKSYQRAARNRDKALEQFPPTVIAYDEHVVHYDASSNKIRRERFSPFFHHPLALFAVGVIPTRSGFHVSAGRNPWNQPPAETIHIGEMMESYGGGGHLAVGGSNARDLAHAREIAAEVAIKLRAAGAKA